MKEKITLFVKKNKKLLFIIIIFLLVLFYLLRNSFKKDININTVPVASIAPEKEILLEAVPVKSNEIKIAPPFSLSSTVSSLNNYLIGIDKINNKLIKIENSNKVILYSDPVADFSHSGSFVVAIPLINPNKVILINMDNKTTESFSFNNIDSIISASFDPSTKRFFLLGNYNINTRLSTLFIANIDNPNVVEEKINLSANKIEYMGNNLLLTQEFSDSLDKGIIGIFDLNQNKYTLKNNANNFLLSPSKENVLVESSKKTLLISSIDLSKRDLPVGLGNKIMWKDNYSILEIISGQGSITINEIDSNSLSIIKTYITSINENTSIVEIIGIENNLLYLMNKLGKFISVNLE